MDPSLIVSGIRTAIRLSRAGDAAYTQYARDKEALFPPALEADVDPAVRVADFFTSTPERATFVTGDDAPYQKYWLADGRPDESNPNAVNMLYAAYLEITAKEAARKGEISDINAEPIAGAAMIEQWAKGKGPVGPIAGIILTMADIALEYVGANPSILGIGGNGEKLLGALAANLSEMIPDDTSFGPKQAFAERLIGTFLHAGLQTLSENVALVVPEKNLQELVARTLPPIIDALPDSIAEQLAFRDVVDALAGPAASVALQTIADHPTAFLGSEFNTETAVGALTQALLQQASKTGLTQPITEEGFIGLYQAALGVAAEQPKLFVGRNGNPAKKIAEDLFTNVIGVLSTASPPFNGDFGARLAVAVLDAVPTNALLFAGSPGPWEQSVAAVANEVLSGLQDGMSAGGAQGLALFSKAQLIDLARIFVTQAAATPGLLGSGNGELRDMIGAVVKALPADRLHLLTAGDWLAIARVAAEEAAANPGRLFGAGSSAGDGPATAVMETLLAVASGEFEQSGRSGKTVLFGATLREAIVVVLRETAGNPEGTTSRLQAIAALAKQVSTFVSQEAGHYGSKEWLGLFRGQLATVLAGTNSGALTRDAADKLLQRGV